MNHHHHFKGKDIPHIKLSPKTTIEELVEIYASTGFNGRQLGEAAKLFAKMIEEDATICLTVAGAMTPVGFGGIFKTLIERGFVDWIVTTGANVYHEDHFTQQGYVIKKVQLRLYIEKIDEKLGKYSLITSQVETDKGTIEMIYDEGYRGLNSLDRASKFLTENLGISALILRSIIALDSQLEKKNS